MGKEKLPNEVQKIEVDENGVVLTPEEIKERRQKQSRNFEDREQK